MKTPIKSLIIWQNISSLLGIFIISSCEWNDYCTNFNQLIMKLISLKNQRFKIFNLTKKVKLNVLKSKAPKIV